MRLISFSHIHKEISIDMSFEDLDMLIYHVDKAVKRDSHPQDIALLEKIKGIIEVRDNFDDE